LGAPVVAGAKFDFPGRLPVDQDLDRAGQLDRRFFGDAEGRSGERDHRRRDAFVANEVNTVGMYPALVAVASKEALPAAIETIGESGALAFFTNVLPAAFFFSTARLPFGW
jgi:hypothetical protein